jgi:hypothetical protein
MSYEKAKKVPEASSWLRLFQRESPVMRVAVGMPLLNATIPRPHRGKRILRVDAPAFRIAQRALVLLSILSQAMARPAAITATNRRVDM